MSDTNEMAGPECFVHFDNAHQQVRRDFLGLCTYDRADFEKRRKEEPDQECMARCLRLLETLTQGDMNTWHIEMLRAKEKGLQVSETPPKTYPQELTYGIIGKLLSLGQPGGYKAFGESTIRNSMGHLEKVFRYIGRRQTSNNSIPRYWLKREYVQAKLKQQAESRHSGVEINSQEEDIGDETERVLKSTAKRPKSTASDVKSTAKRPKSTAEPLISTPYNITSNSNNNFVKEAEEAKASPDPNAESIPSLSAAAASDFENAEETTEPPPAPPDLPIAIPTTPFPETPVPSSLSPGSVQAIGNQSEGIVAALVPQEPWQECCEFYNHKRGGPYTEPAKIAKQEEYARKLVALFTLEQIEKIAGKMDSRDDFWKKRGGCETWDTHKHYLVYLKDAGVSLYASTETQEWRPPARPGGKRSSPRVIDTPLPAPVRDEQQALLKLQDDMTWLAEQFQLFALREQQGRPNKPESLALVDGVRQHVLECLQAAGLPVDEWLYYNLVTGQMELPSLPVAAMAGENGLHIVRA